MFTSVDKALISLVGAIAYLGDYTGFYSVPDGALATVVGVIPALVWLIPNRGA